MKYRFENFQKITNQVSAFPTQNRVESGRNREKFKNLKTGHISVNDGDETFTFGDSNSDEKVSVDIHSQEFYVMTGSGGALGIAEAYVAGYWSSDDVVKLFQIICVLNEHH